MCSEITTLPSTCMEQHKQQGKNNLEAPPASLQGVHLILVCLVLLNRNLSMVYTGQSCKPGKIRLSLQLQSEMLQIQGIEGTLYAPHSSLPLFTSHVSCDTVFIFHAAFRKPSACTRHGQSPLKESSFPSTSLSLCSVLVLRPYVLISRGKKTVIVIC